MRDLMQMTANRSIRLALATSVLFAASLQAQQVADPANLTGEHVSPQDLADTLPINHGAAALEQLLVKLRTRASMMLIVAHPDDEDGGFLTYESRGQGARVAMLTLNRGEGGQNLMSADFDDALGLIRTQELLAADRYMGVDQFFGTEVDFGFSKTKEEAFAKWTHERVLYDAVRCVRLYRPLVIASVFVGGVTDGHGQHQVSGEIAQEVFNAAADPKVFPEMGLPAWAPLKVYARVPFARVTAQGMYDYATGKWAPPVFHNYVTGKDIDHEPGATVTIHEGDKSTLIGMNGDTYIQFARKGLMLQKSQIGSGGRGPVTGAFDVGYTLMGSRLKTQKPTEDGVFDGIDTSLAGIATLAPDAGMALQALLRDIDANLGMAQIVFETAHPEKTVDPLRTALKTMDAAIASTVKQQFDATEKYNLLHELRVKRVQLNNALVLAHGITMTTEIESDSNTGGSGLVGGQHISLLTTDKGVRENNLSLKSSRIIATPSTFPPDSLVVMRHAARQLQLASNAPVTRPYFSRPNSEQPFYNLSDPLLRNAPATPAPLVDSEILDDNDVPIEVQTIISAPASASNGRFRQAAVIVPAASVSISPTAGIVRLGESSLSLTTVTRSALSGSTTLQGPAGWPVTSNRLEEMGPNKVEHFTIKPGQLQAGNLYQFTAVANFDHHDFTESYRPVGYSGLTYTNYYTPATYKAVAVDVKTSPDLKIAYLPGTGDSVSDFLPNIGVTPTVIGLSQLTADQLSQFDAVILGVRAYAAHPELGGAGSKPLIDFARAGGVVIVQYNNGKYGESEAPYPITTVGSSGDHAHDVVDETMPVVVLEPSAPLMAWPNKITSADFNNWVDERGHAFAGTWSKEYTSLLETHDPGQEPQKGSLLVAPVGKGAYIYCGLALYRQLPQGVPGAYRLFANLLSYAKNPRR